MSAASSKGGWVHGAQGATGGGDGSRPSERQDGVGEGEQEEPWEKMPEERRIAAEMRSVGRSIEEIAEELNRDHSTVWRWLNKDDATEAYLRVLGEQRRQCWLTLAQVATEQALQVVVDAVSSGDQKIAVKWLEILTRDEVGRDRLWSEP